MTHRGVPTFLSVLICVLPDMSALAALPVLEPPYYVYPATSPRYPVSVDFDGDGNMDVLTSNWAGIQLMRGQGDGTFGAYEVIASGNQFHNFYHFAYTELNGDGRPDLVVCDFGTLARTYVGTSDGGFVHDRDLATPSGNCCVVVADLNHDGWKDIVIANRFSDKVSIFRSGGYGGFYPAVNIVSGSGAAAVAVRDMNGDTHPDILAVNAGSGTMSFHSGDGLMGFAPPVSFATPPSPSWLDLADLNEDGHVDAVVTSTGQDKVSMFPGNGLGGFGPRLDYAAGADPGHVLLADIDDDAHVDAIVCDNGQEVSVFQGSGSGTLTTPRSRYVMGVNTRGTAVADFNNDGAIDIVTATPDYVDYPVGNIAVLLSKAGGEFPPQRIHLVGGSPRLPAAADLNNDGYDDIVVPNAGTDNVSVLLSLGDGNLQTAVNYPVGDGPIEVLLTDLDNDGLDDFVTCNINGTTVSVARGLGTGSFSTAVMYSAGSNPSSIVTGDFDEDGLVDLGVGHLFGGPVSVLMNLGGGVFGPNTPVANLVAASLGTADVNEDGHLDFIVGLSNGQGIRVLPGDGNAAFGSPLATSVPIAKGIPSVMVADLNNDSQIDLLATVGENDNVPSHVVSFLGDGTGVFGTPRTYSIGPAIGNVVARDINNDGFLDFVSVSQTAYVAAGGLGDGTGAFQDQFRLGVQNPYGVTFADLNGDEAPDLAVTSVSNNTVTTMLNIPVLVSGVIDGRHQGSVVLAAFPNPAIGAVSVRFDLERPSSGSLCVFDLSGRLVQRLFEGRLEAGHHDFTWNGEMSPAEGIYFIRLAAGEQSSTTRVIRLAGRN